MSQYVHIITMLTRVHNLLGFTQYIVHSVGFDEYKKAYSHCYSMARDNVTALKSPICFISSTLSVFLRTPGTHRSPYSFYSFAFFRILLLYNWNYPVCSFVDIH